MAGAATVGASCGWKDELHGVRGVGCWGGYWADMNSRHSGELKIIFGVWAGRINSRAANTVAIAARAAVAVAVASVKVLRSVFIFFPVASCN